MAPRCNVSSRDVWRAREVALHVLGAGLEVRVASVDVAPRIQDRDDRLVLPVVCIQAHLAQARAMAERAEVLQAQPTMGTECVGRLAGVHRACRWEGGTTALLAAASGPSRQNRTIAATASDFGAT